MKSSFHSDHSNSGEARLSYRFVLVAIPSVTFLSRLIIFIFCLPDYLDPGSLLVCSGLLPLLPVIAVGLHFGA